MVSLPATRNESSPRNEQPPQRFDLNDFEDHRINDRGELEVGRYFDGKIRIDLGSEDHLELTRYEVGDSNEWKKDNIYVLRNPDGGDEAYVIFSDSDEVEAEIPKAVRDALPDGKIICYPRLVIGRETTPELELGEYASREHFELRIGSLQRQLHFRDLGSKNGTVVTVESGSISSPRKRMLEGGALLAAEKKQWPDADKPPNSFRIRQT